MKHLKLKRRPRETTTLVVATLEIGDQMLLPFSKRSASNAHTRAQRLGMKIVTCSVVKYDQVWTRLTRVA